MAKMFYTLEEAKGTLEKSDEQINQLTREGRLREFRDGPRLMFKADQVDDLATELKVAQTPTVKFDLLHSDEEEIVDVTSTDDLDALSGSSVGLKLDLEGSSLQGSSLLGLSDSHSGLSGLIGLASDDPTNTLNTEFVWEGMNRSGQQIKGEMKAASSEEVISKIREEGNYPTRVKAKSKPSKAKTASTSQQPKSEKVILPKSISVFLSLTFLLCGFAIGFLACYVLLAS